MDKKFAYYYYYCYYYYYNFVLLFLQLTTSPDERSPLNGEKGRKGHFYVASLLGSPLYIFPHRFSHYHTNVVCAS